MSANYNFYIYIYNLYLYLQFNWIFSVAVYKSLGLGPKEKHEATNFGFAKVTDTFGNTLSRIKK